VLPLGDLNFRLLVEFPDTRVILVILSYPTS
jgi:hypothetical protein